MRSSNHKNHSNTSNKWAQHVKDQMLAEFTHLFYEVMMEWKLINIAVKNRASIRDAKYQHYSAKIKNEGNSDIDFADSLQIFEANGSVKPSDLVKFESKRFTLQYYGLSALNFRERLILDAVLFYVHAQIYEKYASLFSKDMLADPESELFIVKNYLDDLIRDFLAKYKVVVNLGNRLKFLDKPLGNKLCDEAKYALEKMLIEHRALHIEGIKKLHVLKGPFVFPESNVITAAGPQIKNTFEKDFDINRLFEDFINNLFELNVAHVFAIGTIFPQIEINSGSKESEYELIPADFSNYFLPEANGFVKLPNEIAKFYKIESKMIERVGRITTYEVKINDKDPIQVHHVMQLDKGAFKFSLSEIGYISVIKNYRSEGSKQILTHCRGKGRSDFWAYVLASNHLAYSTLLPINRLKKMRLAREGKESSKAFISNESQEIYLLDEFDSLVTTYTNSLLGKAYVLRLNIQMVPTDLLDSIFKFDCQLRQKIEEYNRLIELPNSTITHKMAYIAFFELYYQLHNLQAYENDTHANIKTITLENIDALKVEFAKIEQSMKQNTNPSDQGIFAVKPAIDSSKVLLESKNENNHTI